MPICRPESPRFTTSSERTVWARLHDQLRPVDLLCANLRITDRAKDHEADLVVAMPGAGVAVIEVKGGSVWHDGRSWQQTLTNGSSRRARPVDQARGSKYALRSFIESDPRWTQDRRSRIRWAHVVVLPASDVASDFALPDCPRWMVVDRTELKELASLLWDVLTEQETGHRPADQGDVELIGEILRGRGRPQRDLVARAHEREARADQLTEDQAVILGATRQLRRVEVRGGAGSGKTWLAMEQARRLAQAGERVALTCYSRGLAEFLRRTVATWPRRARPAYVGEFLSLGLEWGAEPGTDDDSDYWERRLPEQMLRRAADLPDGQRFDSVVVDESQDFAQAWWPALLAALRDEENGGVYVYTDEGQQVFARYGPPPVPLLPLVLDHNLRNTRQIGDVFNPLTPMPMRLLGDDGPAVRFIECAADEALSGADDEVDALLEQGWRPEDVALLTTGSRHPEQVARQAAGQDVYWRSFWDADQVFYGHVLGFKGMERRAVVLAINERQPGARSRERLYVGLSRARDALVVVGDPEHVREAGGERVLARLAQAKASGSSQVGDP